ncbi:hypothetical protein C1929_07630 [Stenotrophomonas sp. ZAC14D1_NAIMI4_6]|nr:hypothetical protein C1929_07630 [Stenotrophomonas sp. ZAC14D1_NAIMI4_6]AWH40820.1 hypothetical protein C1927_07955 [Stenotrophomonas sp. ZAC14D1_NAIMI4_1]
MADGAAQRLVAKMAQILFGQPGLTLMELTERVKGMQPSRAGQVDALVTDQMVMAALQAVTRETLAGVLDCDSKVIGILTAYGIDGAVHIPTMVRAMLEAALAARPPVHALVRDSLTVGREHQMGQEPAAWATHHDEPMLYPTFSEAAAHCDDNEAPIPLYPIPLAQADDVEPRAMDTAPRDGTMVRLLVQFEDNATEDTAKPAWTIGACNDNYLGEDERTGWRFAGWCWTHDHFTEGKGVPVGWLPLINSRAVGSG